MFDLPLGDRFAVVGTNRDHPAVKKRLDFLMTGGDPCHNEAYFLYVE